MFTQHLKEQNYLEIFFGSLDEGGGSGLEIAAHYRSGFICPLELGSRGMQLKQTPSLRPI